MNFFKSKDKTKCEVEKLPFKQTEKKDEKKGVYNTKAIGLRNCEEVYFLEPNFDLTNIQVNIQIEKASGKLNECSETIKSHQQPTYYSGFLGIINIMGDNFLLMVKDVHVLFVLDGKDKIYEIVSVEFLPVALSGGAKTRKEVTEFANDLEKLLGSGGYYFSYTYPLSLSQQKIHISSLIPLNKDKKYQNQVDNDFLWNGHLLKPLIQHKISTEWMPQLIQGSVFNFIIGEDTKQIGYYTMISRRQCRRGGTRFNHRGVDSQGFVANFVESEQIVFLPEQNRVLSHVQIRGSVPSHWTQKGLSAKLVLEQSKELSKQAASQHFEYLKSNYQSVICVNLMSDSKKDEVKLTKEFRTMVSELCEQEVFAYHEFDFHHIVKGDRFENIDTFIFTTAHARMIEMGFFHLDRNKKEVLSMQKGVIRTNCLDCLDRTNFFQLRVAHISLTSLILPKTGLSISNDARTFHKNFLYCWGENGDKISRHYADTNATTSTVAKKGKQGVLGFISGKLTSAKRFFKGTITDSYKQQCYCILLGEHFETQENLQYQEGVFEKLKLRESEFVQTNSVTIFICSWSVNSFVPDKKAANQLACLFKNNYHTTDKNYKFTDNIASDDKLMSMNGQSEGTTPGGRVRTATTTSIHDPNKCDLVVVCLQEVSELSSKNFLKSEQAMYEAAQEAWRDVIRENIGDQYFCVDSHNMAGITTFVFARTQLSDRIQNVECDGVPSSLSGKLLNKGGVGLRFAIDDSTIGILNVHIPAGQSNVSEKVSSLQYVHQNVFQKEGMAAYKRDPISKSDKVILAGNLNFRVDKKSGDCKNIINEVIDLQKGLQLQQAQSKLQSNILAYDMLSAVLEKSNQNQRNSSLVEKGLSQIANKYCDSNPQEIEFLKNYYERKISFLPTYKFDVGSGKYDSSWKQRIPSYCDRILIADNESENVRIEESFLHYDSIPGIDYSDHKPVIALISFPVKRVDEAIRDSLIENILASLASEQQQPQIQQIE